MSGRATARRVANRLRRWDFSLITTIAGILVVLLISYSILDFIRTAQIQDQQAQESALRGQLAEFLLALREPDGSSLLENPVEFSKASRPLQVVSLRKSFFYYFLTRDNARLFRAEDIAWDPPRTCTLEFAGGKRGDAQSTATLQACFAAIPGDVLGRYIYFAIRYPTLPIHRHEAGRYPFESDHLVIRLVGDRAVALALAFDPPSLASARYPSQMKRFDGLHELAAFSVDEPSRPSRLVSGQAYERMVIGPANTAQNIVTVVGRIDSSILSARVSDPTWPGTALKALRIGIDVLQYDETAGTASKTFSVPVGANGNALVSLAQAYLATVPSRAVLEISRSTVDQQTQAVWRSVDAGLASQPRLTGWTQRFSDWWTEHLIRLLGKGGQGLTARQTQQVPGQQVYVATLTAKPTDLPDIATRAFAGLSMALVGVVILGAIWFRALSRLHHITRTAYAMIASHRARGSLVEYAGRRDEIGTLGRVLHLLIARSRSRSISLLLRIKQEESKQVEEVRLANEHVKARQALLDAIGHEIRSPLQSLLNKTTPESETRPYLERMRRAVDTLFHAASLESALPSGDVVLKTGDVADFLQKLARNASEEGEPVAYVGPPAQVFAVFDPIPLAQILENLIDNALRYRKVGSKVVLNLKTTPDTVVIEVVNNGPAIAEAELETIFAYGVSDSMRPENRGLGLFLSRMHAVSMRGSMRAENRSEGVAILLELPRSEQPPISRYAGRPS